LAKQGILVLNEPYILQFFPAKIKSALKGRTFEGREANKRNAIRHHDRIVYTNEAAGIGMNYPKCPL
jgi:hypothetical protein